MTTPVEKQVIFGEAINPNVPFEADEILHFDLTPTCGTFFLVMLTLVLVLGFWDEIYDFISAVYRLFKTRLARWLSPANRPLTVVLKSLALILFAVIAYISLTFPGGQFLSGLTDGLYLTGKDMANYCFSSPRDLWYLEHLGQSRWLAELHCRGLDAGMYLGDIFKWASELIGIPEGEIDQIPTIVLAVICVLFFFEAAWTYYALMKAGVLRPDDKKPSATPNAPSFLEREHELKLQMQALIDYHATECTKYKEEIKAQEERFATEANEHRATRQQMEENKALVGKMSQPNVQLVQPQRRDLAIVNLTKEIEKKNKQLKELGHTAREWEHKAIDLEAKLKDLEHKANAAEKSLSKKVHKQQREQKHAKEYLTLSKKYTAMERQLNESREQTKAAELKAQSTEESLQKKIRKQQRKVTQARKYLAHLKKDHGQKLQLDENKEQTKDAEPKGNAPKKSLPYKVQKQQREKKQAKEYLALSKRYDEVKRQLQENQEQTKESDDAQAEKLWNLWTLSEDCKKLEHQLHEEREKAKRGQEARARQERSFLGEMEELKCQLGMERRKAEEREEAQSEERRSLIREIDELTRELAMERLPSDSDEEQEISDNTTQLTDQLNAERAEVQSLREALAARDRELGATQSRLDAELEELRTKVPRLEKELNGLQIENELMAGLNETNERPEGSGAIIQESDAAIEQIETLKQQSQSLELQLATCQRDHAQAEGATITAKAHLSAIQDSFNRRLDNACAAANTAEEQAAENAEQAKHYEGLYKTQAGYVEKLESELSNLKRYLNKLEGEGSSQEIPKRRTGDMGSISSALDESRVKVVELERQNATHRKQLSGRGALQSTGFGVNGYVQQLQADLAREKKERENDRVMWHRRTTDLESENQRLRIYQSNASAPSASPFHRRGGNRSRLL